MKAIKHWVRVKVPASTANLGPGYDVLGIALKLYNELEVSVEKAIPGKQIPLVQIEVQGEGSDSLPKDERHVVWQAMKKVFSDYRFPASLSLRSSGIPPMREPIADYRFRLKQVNRIPLARGLGSSASAFLSGILAANALCNHFMNQSQVLNLAAQMEGHPDNVAPQLMGGLCISMIAQQQVQFIKLEMPKDLRAVVCVPEFELSTKKARAVLPKMIAHQDAVFNLSRVSLLLGSLIRRDYRYLKIAMEDKLHQNYRKKLVPGFDSVIKNGYSAGALGMALSGAGPSMLALVSRNKAKAVGQAMKRGFNSAGYDSESYTLNFDSAGAKVEH